MFLEFKINVEIFKTYNGKTFSKYVRLFETPFLSH